MKTSIALLLTAALFSGSALANTYNSEADLADFKAKNEQRLNDLQNGKMNSFYMTTAEIVQRCQQIATDVEDLVEQLKLRSRIRDLEIEKAQHDFKDKPTMMKGTIDRINREQHADKELTIHRAEMLNMEFQYLAGIVKDRKQK